MTEHKLPRDAIASSVPPCPEYIEPAGARRVRLQRLPPGNFRLLFEAEGRSGHHVVYGSVELGRTTAAETLLALGQLCALVAEQGLPAPVDR